MPTRAKRYSNSYSAVSRSAERWGEIQANIRDEQDQLQALQSLISQERSTLANLEQVYKTSTATPDLATNILKETFAGDIQAQRIAAAAGKAATRTLPPAYTAAANAAKTSGGAIDAAEKKRLGDKAIEIAKNKNVSAAEIDAMINDLRSIGATAAADTVRTTASAITGRPAKPTAPALSAEDRAKAAGVRASLEAVAMASPLGYVGGFEGEAAANQLATTPVDTKEGVSFATQKDALDRYVQMLDDGIASPEELARVTGTTDPEQASKEFAYAQGVYNQAKAAGAFQNKDRKYFESAWLDQAKRVAELQAKAARAEAAYNGRTPAQEAAYRELKARGQNPDDPYMQYTGTKTYDYLRKADEIYGSTKGQLEPATPAQERIVTLLQQYDTMKQPWKVVDLEKQLGKTLKGQELTDAIGFALAYDRAGIGKTPAQTQADLQVAAKKAAESKKNVAEFERQRVNDELARAQERKALTEKMIAEQEPVQAVSALRTAQAQAQAPSRRYQQLRASGLDAQTARAQVLTEFGTFTTPSEAPGALAGAPAGRAPGQLTPEGVPVRAALGAITTPTPAQVEARRVPLPEEENVIQMKPVRLDLGEPAPAAPKAPVPKPATPKGAAKVAPAPKAAPAPVSEIDQIKGFIKTGAIKPGTPQYDRALQRLDELEGVR